MIEALLHGKPGKAWSGDYWFSRLHLDMQEQGNDGRILREHPKETWNDEKPPAGLETVTTFALPLDQFRDSDTLRARLVKPILDVISKEADQLGT